MRELENHLAIVGVKFRGETPMGAEISGQKQNENGDIYILSKISPHKILITKGAKSNIIVQIPSRHLLNNCSKLISWMVVQVSSMWHQMVRGEESSASCDGPAKDASPGSYLKETLDKPKLGHVLKNRWTYNLQNCQCLEHKNKQRKCSRWREG